jgi:hypothetical protein
MKRLFVLLVVFVGGLQASEKLSDKIKKANRRESSASIEIPKRKAAISLFDVKDNYPEYDSPCGSGSCGNSLHSPVPPKKYPSARDYIYPFVYNAGEDRCP